LNINENFLPNDQLKAKNEMNCANNCITRMEHSLYEGELEQAKRSAVDFLNSIRELERMQVEHGQIDDMVKALKDKGVNVEKIYRAV